MIATVLKFIIPINKLLPLLKYLNPVPPLVTSCPLVHLFSSLPPPTNLVIVLLSEFKVE